MRKIEEKVCGAFVRCESDSLDNTITDGATLWLWQNRIAWRENGILHMTLCGHNTQTTRSRLNAVLALMNRPERFSHVRGNPTFNGRKITADDIIRTSSAPY